MLRQPMLRLSLLMVVAGVVGFGCAAARPYQTNFAVPTLDLQEKEDLVKGGVQMGIRPITRENSSQFPQVVRSVNWREINKDAGGMRGPGQISTETVRRGGMVELAPLPAFYIGIANKTGTAISLARVQVEVEDSASRRYQLISKTEDVGHRFFTDSVGSRPQLAADQGLLQQLTNEARKLPIFSSTVTIANDEVWRGYLVLNLDAHTPSEYYAMMKPIQSFTVRLKNVPTREGPSEFVFVVDKTNRSSVLTCPGDVTEPLPEKCEMTAATAPNEGPKSKP